MRVPIQTVRFTERMELLDGLGNTKAQLVYHV
jgi:hypothetical protein